jgi:hypothetical protein
VRVSCLLTAAAAALLMIPGAARGQDPDILWTENFSNRQFERAWTQETGNWDVWFTTCRGYVNHRRNVFVWEASMRTPVSEGEPLGSWRSISRMRCNPSTPSDYPDILQVRHNVTPDQRGLGLEIAFRESGPSQIRLVRYDPGYAQIQPYLAQVDTLLNPRIWYTVKLSVLHQQVGESRVAEVQAKVWKQGESEPEEWLLEGISTVAVEDGNDFGIGALNTSIPTPTPFIEVDYVTVLVNKSPVEATSWGQVKRLFR